MRLVRYYFKAAPPENSDFKGYHGSVLVGTRADFDHLLYKWNVLGWIYTENFSLKEKHVVAEVVDGPLDGEKVYASEYSPDIFWAKEII